MQIPKNLPQFEKKTLIIVSGAHEARYLSAYQGNIEELYKFKTEKITYSDREGHFLRSGFGKIFGSGSVYEKPKEQELIEFANEFEKQTKKVVTEMNPQNTILLCPDYTLNLIVERLSTDIKNKTITINGNYYKNKTVKLLEIIEKEIRRLAEKQNSPEIMSAEAKKILEKGL